jgi:hypothetical protein
MGFYKDIRQHGDKFEATVMGSFSPIVKKQFDTIDEAHEWAVQWLNDNYCNGNWMKWYADHCYKAESFD